MVGQLVRHGLLLIALHVNGAVNMSVTLQRAPVT
jgi:hypothetical protein